MAKRRKDSMALFEVVAPGKRQKRKTPLAIPDWMKKSNVPDEAPAKPASRMPPESHCVASSRAEAVPDAAPTDDEMAGHEPARYEAADDSEPAGRADEQDQAVLSLSPGRVTLSLNYVSCAVVATGLVLALVAAFMLGRASAPAAPGDDENTRAAAGTGLVLGKSPSRGAPRISGKHYLVIQQLAGRTAALKADAEAVAAYCKGARGDHATVVDDGQQYVVLSARPFDSRTSPEALEYAAEIHELGKRYKADENNRYNFNQMDSRGRLDPWFEVEP